MRFQKQLNMHRPEIDLFGDCDRTAIACLLDLDPSEVPHWFDGPRGGGMEQKQAWLAERGLGAVECPYPGDWPIESVLQWASAFAPKGLAHTLIGTSRTGCNHVVICRDGEIIWDPSLVDSGIVGPCHDDGYWYVGFIVRLT